jgi:uncharacterized membrane protein YeaQ/YmgE (transglycosylase-associated protein family)
MTWTVTNLVIEIIAGIVGAHAISAAAKEYSFGVIGHTIAGAVGGAFSGYFLQTLAATVVDSTGQVQQCRRGHAMAAARIHGARGRRHPDDGRGVREAQH